MVPLLILGPLLAALLAMIVGRKTPVGGRVVVALTGVAYGMGVVVVWIGQFNATVPTLADQLARGDFGRAEQGTLQLAMNRDRVKRLKSVTAAEESLTLDTRRQLEIELRGQRHLASAVLGQPNPILSGAPPTEPTENFAAEIKFCVIADWLPWLGAQFAVGLDLFCTAFITVAWLVLAPAAWLAAWRGQFMSAAGWLVALGAITGVAASLDVLLLGTAWSATVAATAWAAPVSTRRWPLIGAALIATALALGVALGRHTFGFVSLNVLVLAHWLPALAHTLPYAVVWTLLAAGTLLSLPGWGGDTFTAAMVGWLLGVFGLLGICVLLLPHDWQSSARLGAILLCVLSLLATLARSTRWRRVGSGVTP